ncbi:hypothetical protein BKA70DRAFT_1268951 [Coprinopsis sp. MPI-PUGE-AT-0042]|nr:hypothetical protein BKA70DRAFT_1268951 [Coprinopsis sp. MPI-PUGE-AT-0042]
MAPEKLDIEEDEERQRRLQSLFERINIPGSSAAPTQQAGMPKFDFGDRNTFEVKPNTELLSRLQAFLPEMQASNEALLKRAAEDPDSIDIENITEGSEKVIEMDLGLGVFEERKGDKRSSSDTDEDSSMSDSSSSASSSSSSSSSSSRSSSDDSIMDDVDGSQAQSTQSLDVLEPDSDDYDSDASEEIITCFKPDRPTRPLPKRFLSKAISTSTASSSVPSTKPLIVVLDEQTNETTESI